MKLLTLAAVAAATLIAAPSMAAIVDFRSGVNGANGTYETLTVAGGGVTLDVTAGAYAFDTIIDTDVDGFGDLAVSKRNAGLGVVLASLPGLGPDINGAVDLLTFTVLLNRIVFGNVDGNDDFDFFADGVIAQSDVGISGSNPAAFDGLLVSQFSIGADALGLRSTDDFTVAAIDVDVAPIPLPAGLPLLAGGIALLGAARLRKRR